jgi:hypothetical protein
MEALISVTEDSDEARSLLDWLRQEDDFRGRVRLSPVAPKPGHMGGISDTLTVALGSGGAVTVLAMSISVWLKHRRSDLTVEVSIGDRTVKIDGKRVKADPDSVQQLVEAAGRALVQD